MLKPRILKVNLIFFFLVLLLTIMPGKGFNAFAQEPGNHIGLNVQLTHYIAKEEGERRYFIPINPGCEILYKHSLNNKISLQSGINYSYSVWIRKAYFTSQFKRFSHEVSIPILIKKR